MSDYLDTNQANWDARADVRVEGAAGEVLSELADALIA